MSTDTDSRDATDSRVEDAVSKTFDVAATKLVEQLVFIPARFRPKATAAAAYALDFAKQEIIRLFAGSGRVDIVAGGDDPPPIKIVRQRKKRS